MTDILIITTIIILLTISAWLFHSLEKANTELNINTSLSPKTSIDVFSLPPTITDQLFFVKKIREIISSIKFKRIRHLYAPIPMLVNREEFAPRIVRYNGFAQIPLKVYQGDSYTITLTLNPSIRSPLPNEKPIKVYRQGDKVNLTLTVSSREKEYLEIELMAAGFSVDGEKKQSQLLLSDALHYQWNCFFEKSGSHSFSFIFRVIDSSNKALQIGRIEQTIRVVQIDHLTQRQVWILASSAGVMSGILTLAEILRNLGVW